MRPSWKGADTPADTGCGPRSEQLGGALNPENTVRFGPAQAAVARAAPLADSADAAMSARAIVAGALKEAPVERTAKASGKPFVIATIRERVGQQSRYWMVFAFDEAVRAELVRLGDGDPVAVAGEFEAEIWAPEGGQARVTWKIAVDGVVSAHRRPKQATR
jgi:hypothetical protein